MFYFFHSRIRAGDNVTVDDSSETETEESVPDLDDPDVQLAASRIQSAFKGLKDRKRVQALKQKAKEELQALQRKKAGNSKSTSDDDDDDEMPDLKDKGVQDAAVKIQSAFRGHKVRRTTAHKKSASNDALPNLKDKKVQAAATKIQSAFR